jgi:hypothetical protein
MRLTLVGWVGGPSVGAVFVFVFAFVSAGRTGAQCPSATSGGLFYAPSDGSGIGSRSEFRTTFPQEGTGSSLLLRSSGGVEAALVPLFEAENVLVPAGPLPIDEDVVVVSRNGFCEPVESCDFEVSRHRIVDAPSPVPPTVQVTDARVFFFVDNFSPCYSSSTLFEGADENTPFLHLTFASLGEGAVRWRPETEVRRRDEARGVTLVARENAPIAFTGEFEGTYVRLEEFRGQTEVTVDVTLVGLDGQRGEAATETFVIDAGCQGSSCRDGSGDSTTPVVVGCLWVLRRRRKSPRADTEVRQTLRTSDDAERP